MSETPETDEASFDYDARAEYWVDAEFARKLERERDALKKQLADALTALYKEMQENERLNDILYSLSP